MAAAAYRSSERLYNHRTGLWHDFTNKGGLVHSEILLPDHAPAHYHDRAILWNSVEHAEKAKNARTAREIEIALPAELDRQEQINIAREYVQDFVRRGMCADLCVHDKDGSNPHAHIMLTTRPINPDGTWAAKAAKEYILDRRGQKIMLPSGEYKSRKIPTVDWDSRENAERWREAWARIVNRELERQGLPTIEHRSFVRQGLDLKPTIHMGKAAELERQGIATERGEQNRAIEARNARRERGRHIRNLDERNYSQRKQREEQVQKQPPTYEQWLEGHKKEQARGLERGR